MKKIVFLSIIFFWINHISAQWQQTTSPNGGSVNCFANSGTNIFSGTDTGGTFLSSDNGTHWTAVVNGLTTKNVKSIANDGTNTFAGTNNGGVFISSNNGNSWTQVNSGLTNTNVNSLAISGTNIFAGTADGIFLSTNNGNSWTAMNTGLTNSSVYSLAINGTYIYAGTYGGGVFLSSNNGNSWIAANTGLTSDSINSLAISGTDIYAGTYSSGVFMSSDNGSNWTAVNTGLTNMHVWALAVNGKHMYAGTGGGKTGGGGGSGTGGGKGKGGIFLSTDNGNTWTAVNTGLPKTDVRSLVINGTNIFAGTSDGNIWKRALSEFTTGINGLSSDNNRMNIYPNPSNSSINIQYISYQKVEIGIYNMLGEILYKDNWLLDQTLHSIDISAFPQGLYILQVGEKSQKIVKE